MGVDRPKRGAPENMLFSDVARLEGMGPAEAAAATRVVRDDGPGARGPLDGMRTLSVVASKQVRAARLDWRQDLQTEFVKSDVVD